MKPPKRMLIELPTADEIDDLAMSTPELTVRKFEYDRRKRDADLDYAPCKGEMMLVIRGERGTALVRAGGSKAWSLPSGPISTFEEIPKSARRIAQETCGVHLRSMDLAAMYDVVWHYRDVSIKRLHVVYAAITDDDCSKGAEFHDEVPPSMLPDELDRTALDDCSQKQL